MVKVLASHRSFFVNDECIICARKISGKKSSNLRRHLERFHPIELAEFDKSTPPIRIKRPEEESVSDVKRNSKLSNELIEFFISTGISLDHLNNKHLRELLNAIPNFTIPSLEEVQIQMALKLLQPSNESFQESMDFQKSVQKQQHKPPHS
uniref:BED-type domain-containing protein n=1 Tax=Panagrolaimus superbus TaxID=310955 RepID=A0A914XZ59_9BILA